MPTPEELLVKLEERLILGEISEGMYNDLKAKLLAKIQAGGGQAGGMSVSDSVVKGDLTNNSGAASVGNVIVNLPGMHPMRYPPPGSYPQAAGFLAGQGKRAVEDDDVVAAGPVEHLRLGGRGQAGLLGGPGRGALDQHLDRPADVRVSNCRRGSAARIQLGNVG